MGKNKVVLLFSGGIDSTVLLFWLLSRNYEIFPLFINYGQKSYEGELEAINKILKDLNTKNNLLTLNMPELQLVGSGALVGEYPKNISSHNEWYASEFFPNRNMILLSIAATYGYKLQISKIAIGVVGDSYQDTTRTFLEAMEMTLAQSIARYELIAPFAGHPRQKVIEEAYRLQVPLKSTFSCNAMGNRHCLLCTSCYEREKAIQLHEQCGKERAEKSDF
ncbi:7-cyano-7-deazaguanine synthase [Desulfitobacterium hafniense]|uniref:7-cyano-7-deazaguanine synthase 1 n=2 Tax=Desulfitobacterium hafniense TaxID=49338 RepID=QUEC1_DESHY|nr:7-cyano-7-deazaguanine synthase [Desulfitobacterium hafniense]Q24ZT5.1 RecName: Full=7-cyano-7-deazaguanine synthase 1; AltName: Full=7-cyano-7-carbaguanine synthase 1; AltName: Full=PreQ(0) synthase 1; AltName: Full=Queuosine biosynthesis protein QueC 1 [Desulfitobacterium hafniense Y51]KTE91832.1 hypothetical protein AT727_20360 [Desulfitobacterium hafniense]BAE82457.1 hypothetical protein DSY0668 [Desulfitobacterium hafniense Y51]